jgi:hypothetical protein
MHSIVGAKRGNGEANSRSYRKLCVKDAKRRAYLQAWNDGGPMTLVTLFGVTDTVTMQQIPFWR